MTNDTATATTVLNNGVEIPQLGFGVFQVPPDDAQRAVEHAFDVGYRHIDTAAAYNNEAGVGAAIRATGLPRESLFITTKLRNGEQGYDSALAAFEASGRALGLDYVDLYLIHWPSPARDLYIESWRALEGIASDGRARAIGVSNFLEPHIERLVGEASILPSINQLEVHPTYQQRAALAASRLHGIAIEAYSPLGQGADLESDTVRGIADRLGATPAQVVLAWHLKLGHVVIPKSARRERMEENFAATTLALTDEDAATISNLDAGKRIGGDPHVFEMTQIR